MASGAWVSGQRRKEGLRLEEVTVHAEVAGPRSSSSGLCRGSGCKPGLPQSVHQRASEYSLLLPGLLRLVGPGPGNSGKDTRGHQHPRRRLGFLHPDGGEETKHPSVISNSHLSCTTGFPLAPFPLGGSEGDVPVF